MIRKIQRLKAQIFKSFGWLVLAEIMGFVQLLRSLNMKSHKGKLKSL